MPMRRLLAALLIATAAPLPAAAQDGDDAPTPEVRDLSSLLEAFADLIDLQLQATASETGIDRLPERVRAALLVTPRHHFVPQPLAPLAYADTALPIGHGQNISQPFIVALMLSLAEVEASDKVFETGTGAGWMAALLARLADRVVSVEYVEELAIAARARLVREGHLGVDVHTGDGYYGWAPEAPYDVILVKEAVHSLPGPLVAQLAPGGRMVVPIGPEDGPQWLTLVRKRADGRLSQRRVLPVTFGFLPGGERI
jgi:protein-L-isoaspartate(D-aspartate) O-methyltransferase